MLFRSICRVFQLEVFFIEIFTAESRLCCKRPRPVINMVPIFAVSYTHLCYTQLFNLLCEKADDVYGGRLPVHVRCLIDECANIGQIPKLDKLVATIRSREISACLVLQAQSQLKAIYKDNADTIIGNMDTSIFLGGKEPTTLTELAAVLGKETIDTRCV